MARDHGIRRSPSRDGEVRHPLTVVAVIGCAALACSESPTGSHVPEGPVYDPQIPTQWANAVSNPFFPLIPGTTYEYRADSGGEVETVTVEVLAQTRVVQGVTATVVHDRVYVDGELIEDTHDWYAQDIDGNVWYLGEDSREMEGGVVVSTEGSWEWGVDGALPGIYMWGDPAAHLGEEYRQEYYEGEAEDFGEIVALDQAVEVPEGSFTGCIQTQDWNALEPGPRENKYYSPGVGLVLEIDGDGARVELTSFTTP